MLCICLFSDPRQEDIPSTSSAPPTLNEPEEPPKYYYRYKSKGD